MKRLTALKSMNEGSVTALKSSKGDRRARVSNAHIYYIMHAAARGRCHVGVSYKRGAHIMHRTDYFTPLRMRTG